MKATGKPTAAVLLASATALALGCGPSPTALDEITGDRAVELLVDAAAAVAPVCTGDVTLPDQAAVDAFDCSEVTGNLIIGSPSTDISGLGSMSDLTSVGGFLRIRDNPVLTTLDGLSALTSVGLFLNISTNGALTEIDGLSALTSVGGTLLISGNVSLTNVDGLSALTSVGVDLQITFNDALLNIDGLSSLTSVDRNLRIGRNDLLTDFDGLSSLTSVAQIFFIQNNFALTNLDGLSSLTSIGEVLAIANNPVLANIEGLSALTSIGGVLEIRDSPALTNIDGLSALTSVGRFVRIRHNVALTNLDGLSALASISGYLPLGLDIHDNPVLANCAFGLGALLASGGIVGTVTIENNAPGCNSAPEIIVVALSNDGLLTRSHARALTNKLDAAHKKVGKGNFIDAVAKMDAFIAQVTDLELDEQISSEDAEALTVTAQALRDAWAAQI